MPRVFSAVDIEDEKILDKLEDVRDRLDLGFNPVKKEKMHVTLEFFEDITEKQIQELEGAMNELDTGTFQAEIKGIGVFPSKDYIRVVWAGVEAEEFHELHENVSKHGVPTSNDHDFMPHITLLRVKDLSPPKKRKLRKTVEEFKGHSFGTIKVNSVKLFESRLTGKGSKYRLIHEKEL